VRAIAMATLNLVPLLQLEWLGKAPAQHSSCSSRLPMSQWRGGARVCCVSTSVVRPLFFRPSILEQEAGRSVTR